jgi:CRP-like cAMP-binding protein
MLVSDNKIENLFSGITIENEDVNYIQFKKNQIIYSEGNSPIGLYYVQSGKVKIFKLGSDGKEQIIRIAGKGEVLSCASLICNNKYNTSAISLDEALLVFIYKQKFWHHINHNVPEFLQLLSQEIINAEDKMTDLAYKPVRGRLAQALLSLCKKFNGRIESNLTITISRNDLACFIGTATETVNRLISEFRKENIISTSSKNITILNSDYLLQMSNNLYN